MRRILTFVIPASVVILAILALRQPVTCFFFLRSIPADAVAYEHNNGIYLMDANGGGQCPTVTGYWRASWSPDGSHIAYFSGDDQLYISAPDGSNLRRVAEPAYYGSRLMPPSWSPDATQIAYLSALSVSHPRRVHVVTLATGETRPLTDRLDAGTPAWSPDGRQIAFLAPLEDDSDGALYTVTLDGGEPVLLTENAKTLTEFAWSPDGAQIAFVNNAYDIALIDADGSGGERVLLELNSLIENSIPRSLAWSPSGDRLALRVIDLTTYGVYVVTLADGTAVEIASATDGTELAWSADGATLFYTDSAPDSDVSAIFSVPSSGGAPRLLTPGFTPAVRVN